MKKVTKEEVDVAFELLLTALRAADDAHNAYEAKADAAAALAVYEADDAYNAYEDEAEAAYEATAVEAVYEAEAEAAEAVYQAAAEAAGNFADEAWDEYNKLKRKYENGKQLDLRYK